MELEDRAKMEMFLQEHESQLNLPPIQEGETIFEYVVAADGREVSYSKWHILMSFKLDGLMKKNKTICSWRKFC